MKTITPQQWATLEFDSVVVISSQHQLNRLNQLVKKDISNLGSYPHGFPFVLYRTIVGYKYAYLAFSSIDYYERYYALANYSTFRPVKIIFKLLKTKEYSNGKN